jgi:nicotinate-nucleotide adenylyltransferase
LQQWHRAAEIPYAASLIVASRPGQPLEKLKAGLPQGLAIEPAPDGDRRSAGVEVRAFQLVNPAGERAPFYLLPGLDVEISATEVREAIREGARPETNIASADSPSIPTMLPAAVANYIRNRGLYR